MISLSTSFYLDIDEKVPSMLGWVLAFTCLFTVFINFIKLAVELIINIKEYCEKRSIGKKVKRKLRKMILKLAKLKNIRLKKAKIKTFRHQYLKMKRKIRSK
jgi:hypothetical protein